MCYTCQNFAFEKKLLKGHEAIDILIDILHAASMIALLSAQNFVF